MRHCLSLVSSVLRCHLTAVLGDSFVLLSYLCAQCNSGTSHPTRSPHSPSVYIKLNLSSTSGNAEVGYICLPTQRGNNEVGKGFQTFQFYANVKKKLFYSPPLKIVSRRCLIDMWIYSCRCENFKVDPQQKLKWSWRTFFFNKSFDLFCCWLLFHWMLVHDWSCTKVGWPHGEGKKWDWFIFDC